MRKPISSTALPPESGTTQSGTCHRRRYHSSSDIAGDRDFESGSPPGTAPSVVGEGVRTAVRTSASGSGECESLPVGGRGQAGLLPHEGSQGGRRPQARRGGHRIHVQIAAFE